MADVELMFPALAFLLAGVPLAGLLERLGFFDSVVARLVGPNERELRVVWLWVLAALTTIVMNLDTTIVLLTPLYVALARASRVDVLRLALIPLLLASFASSLLPVSNLSNLIIFERDGVTVGQVISQMFVPTVVACVTGWILYVCRWGSRIHVWSAIVPDRSALRVGGVAVAVLLIGFVVGPSLGVEAWMVALVVDLALVAHLRFVPWRRVPVVTAFGVLAMGTLLLLAVPEEPLRRIDETTSAPGLAGIVLLGAVVANVVNNLPTVVVMAGAIEQLGPGSWAWLRGLNIGAVMLPIGALANLLWLRILRSDGVRVTWISYVRFVGPIAAPVVMAVAVTEWGLRAI